MAMTTLSEIVRADLLAYTELVAYMTTPVATIDANGVPGGGWAEGSTDWLLPRMGAEPSGEYQTPFVVINTGGLGGRHVLYGSWLATIYDNPNNGYWRIEHICNLLRLRYSIDDSFLPDTAQPSPWFRKARHEYVSPRIVDNEWKLLKMYVRTSIHAL